MGRMAMLGVIILFICQIWVVVGQSYPSCSVGCISAAVPSACNSTDSVCICQQVDEASLVGCLASNCDCADQQTAATTFGSTCASNGVQVVLNVACAAASTSSTSSSGSIGSTLSPTSAPISSTDPASTLATSLTYSASPSSSSSSSAISTFVLGSTVITTTSQSVIVSTSTAVLVFMSSDSTVVTYITSTHWYTTITSSTLSSISSSTSSPINSSPSAATVSVSQGSFISHGLSTGAKAGIGAGVGAGVVTATVLSLCLLWLCRQRRQKTSSVVDSDDHNSSIVPPVIGPVPTQEKRLTELRHPQELPSDTSSRKPTFSWGTTSPATSSHQRSSPSEEDGFQPSTSAESGQHSPPVDSAAYQRPIQGNDGYWHNAQELHGGLPSRGGGASPAPANFQPLYLQKVQGRPVVPPGKWPPTSHGGFS